ncbi:ChaB family protein [Bradyrhizobium sp.]|jgi:cation transport regulator
MQREKTAHRVAWAAVKRKYEKSGDRWIPRED